MVKFLKKGKEGAEITKQADAEIERRRSDSGNRIFRFWIKEGTEGKITFLDGELNGDGVLDVPRYWEHNVQINGNWKNWFPCTKDEEPCPLCEVKAPSLVYAFTVVDHRKWAEKKNPDKKHQHERKLYICKGDTYKRLSKIAAKRGGLTGCSFDVSRIGDKSENVGNDFDFIEKLSLKKVAKKYGLEKKGKTENNKVCQPYDYEEVIQYYTAEELRDQGLGSGSAPVGSEGKKKDKKKRKKDKKKKVKKNDFDKDL